MIIEIDNNTILIHSLVSTIIIHLIIIRNLRIKIRNSTKRRQQQQEIKRQLLTAKTNAKDWARYRKNTKQRYAPVPIVIATNVKSRIRPHCVDPFSPPIAPKFKADIF